MRIDDLDLKELLEVDPEGGLIRFAGERSLIVDTFALGMLRKILIAAFGQRPARGVLGRFGFAYGWRLADAMKTEFKWATDSEWLSAGKRILMLEGLLRFDPEGDLTSEAGNVITSSFEAEQHLLHLGRSDTPVCWMLSGIASGYLSRVADQRYLVVERQCIGAGDAVCRWVARTTAAWGEQHKEDQRCIGEGCPSSLIDDCLKDTIASLKEAEAKLHEKRRALVRVARDVGDPLGIIAKSASMRQLVDLATRAAKVDSTILISGESGAGKERIARLVHEESPRASRPFIAINCGAITETLLESELFGHARGAFTGAAQDRPGLFEAAHGGTLLLDEIGEISMGMQVKLLRALQEREIRRVGENKSRSVDVRVVAATNRDLAREVAKGTFRQDLYYRLKVVELRVPALRERMEDLLPLARVLLAEAAERMKRKLSGLAPRAADQLLRYDWPGNVRELENAMERAVALARGQRVELEDLPEDIRQALPRANPVGSIRRLEEIEKDYILAALNRNGGNQTRTAEQLGIGSATLYRKLKSYGRTSPRNGASRAESAR